MTAALFLGFLAAVAGAVVALAVRWLPRRTALGVAAGLAAWLLYVGVLGYAGVLRSLRPPGMAFIVVPVVLFVALALARSPAGGRAALAFPLWVLLGLQGFRVGVELVLHQLWLDGLAPRMLTFEGANLDILIGASAPFIAWLAAKGRLGVRPALLWNGLGLLALANVVARSALTAPGPLNLLTLVANSGAWLGWRRWAVFSLECGPCRFARSSRSRPCPTTLPASPARRSGRAIPTCSCATGSAPCSRTPTSPISSPSAASRPTRRGGSRW